MYRAYQPITPANNIFLKKRWDDNRFDIHRRKVQQATAVIENKPPKTYMHLHIKLKKLQMEEERIAIVERDNRILLEKMAHIMRTGGNVETRKHDYVQKSLNRTKRQRELLKITHENLAILKRITSKEPHYNHLQWKHEWKIKQGYMMNISKYPHERQALEEKRRQQQAAANARIRENFTLTDADRIANSGRANRKFREYARPVVMAMRVGNLLSTDANPPTTTKSKEKPATRKKLP